MLTPCCREMGESPSVKGWMEGTRSGVSHQEPVPKTSALKTLPAMWNTQQSTPAPAASHKLQSRVSSAAAPPLLQAVPFTSCPPKPKQPIPVPFPAAPCPAQPGIFQEKKGIPAASTHRWIKRCFWLELQKYSLARVNEAGLTCSRGWINKYRLWGELCSTAGHRLTGSWNGC